MLTTIKYNNRDIQAMLLQLIFPFYDFFAVFDLSTQLTQLRTTAYDSRELWNV